MKRRINLYFISMMLIGLLAISAVSLYWVNNRAQNTARQTLNSYLKATMALTPEFPADPHEFVIRLVSSYPAGVRITLIDLDGRVLGETQAPVDDGENLLEQQEFAQAMATGYGEAVRQSEATGSSALYVARRWGDRALLRYAMPVAETRAFAAGILPVLLLAALVMILLTAGFTGRISKAIMGPYERMFAYLESAIHGGEEAPFEAEYEELEPIVHYFQELLGRITGYIGQLSAKTDEIEAIVGTMEEGLILLDRDMDILLINGQGRRLLGIPADSWQKNILYLYRDEQFCDALADASDNRRQVIADIDGQNGGVNRFYINPAGEGGTVLLISDVTELVRLEQLRSEFAANVSHELKTPLTSISGFAELMQTGMVSDSHVMAEYAGRILIESRRLMALIDDILKLSSLESGQAEATVPVDVAAAFRYAGEVLSEQLADRGVTLTIEGGFTVEASREKIEELALNLVDNAVKYNRSGGSIRVTLGGRGFTVADTGIGIPPEHWDRIFERFYRVDKARSRKTGGTGLGLAISKHIVERYGGRISVSSDRGGAVFTVVFPE